MKLTTTLLTAAMSVCLLTAGALTLQSAPAEKGKAAAAWSAERPSRGDRPERGEGFGRPDGPRGPEGPGGHHGPGAGPEEEFARQTLRPFWENERIAEELALTEEQVATLTASLDLAKESLEATKGSIVAAMEALKEALEADTPDLTTVYELHENLQAAKGEKARAILGHAVTVKTILTAEQEETLKELSPRPPRGPQGPGEGIGDHGALRQDIRELIQAGGTLEDVEALLIEKEIPEAIRERILARVEAMMNGEMPPPPTPPAPPAEEMEEEAPARGAVRGTISPRGGRPSR